MTLSHMIGFCSAWNHLVFIQRLLAVNHLVYMDDLKLYGHSQADVESLVHAANIYFDDVCMEIGAAKCSVVAMLKGHLAEAKDLTLYSGDLITHLSPCST